MQNNIKNLEKLQLHEKIIYAAILVELEPPTTLHNLQSIIATNVTPSRYLTDKVLDSLTENGLVHINRELNTLGLAFINNDETLHWLLDSIKQSRERLSYSTETIDLIKNIYIAECISHMSKLVISKGLKITTSITPPKILTELINVRNINEIKMLSWQMVTNLKQRDIRLMNLNSNENTIEILFSEVATYHENYFKSDRKISKYRLPKKHSPSALSQIISQYLLGISAQEFEIKII